jgi:hypothetical protein
MFEHQFFSRSSQQGLLPEGIEIDFNNGNGLMAKWEIIRDSIVLSKEYKRRQARRLHHMHTRSGGPIRLYFNGFWNDFRPSQSYLYHLASHAAIDLSLGLEIVDDPCQADVSIHSCFDLAHLDNVLHTTRVLYLGENLRPDYSLFDYSITSDTCKYNGRNSYLPVWQIFYYDRFHTDLNQKFADVITEVVRRCSAAAIPWENRDIEVSYVANNNVPKRVAVISKLQSFGIPIQIYGSSFRPLQDKPQLYGRSRYVLCPENSFYPGYITEKILEPIFCGCMILYEGMLSDELNSIISPLTISLDQVLSPDFDCSALHVKEYSHNHRMIFENFIKESSVTHEADSVALFKKVFSAYNLESERTCARKA